MKKVISLAALGMMMAAPSMAASINDDKMFDKMDTNQNGFIEQAEAKGAAKRQFADLDLNKDNQITKQEIADFKAAKTAAKEAKKQEKALERAAKQAERNDKMFDKMDANHDGQIAESEAKGPTKRQFASIDLNKDGQLTKQEVADYIQANKKKS